MATVAQIRNLQTSQLESSNQSLQLDPLVTRLASLMDDAYIIPGTNIRIGLDAIIGLIPGVGDLATALIGSLLLKEAKRLGVTRWTRARMYGNYALDLLIGAIPLVGDLFDVGFKAHRRNLRLLQKHIERTGDD